MAVIIFPEHGKQAQIASLLLQLADNPQDVKTVFDPQLGYSVPDWLFETFQQVSEGAEEAPDAEAEQVEADEPDDSEIDETPAPKRRGRPRKEDSK